MILCDLEDKILGLNHWQKWRDRVLGVGQTYTLPPSAINPYDLDFNGFGRNFIESGENISRFLATKLSFGGYWAKIICEVAGVDAKSMEPDLNKCWISLKNFLEKMDSDAYPLVSDEDILPFGGEKASYNEALDNFFSGLEGDKEIEEVQALDDSLTKKYVDRLEKQKEGLELAEKLSVDKKVMGDLIYQNMTALNSVFQRIRENKKRNMSDKEILEKLGEFTFIKDFKGFEIVCEF